jgi:two-component system sensor histidine kinase KdpD
MARVMHTRRELLYLGGGLLALAIATIAYREWLHVTNSTTVALTFLMVVLLVATSATLRTAVATSLAAMLLFNYFFLPPVGTFVIADLHNWIALFAFLTVSLVASNLSAVARARTQESLYRQDELARLFDLSRDIVMMTEGQQAILALPRSVSLRFDLEFVAIALPRDGWDLHEGGPLSVDLDRGELSQAFNAAKATLEFDARARTYAGHRTISVGGRDVRLVPLRAGTTPIGLLATAGRAVEPGTLEALAGVIAIAVQRADLLEERKAAEVSRKSDELKSALLASLAHDLRTPLTAMRVAAGNLQSPSLGDDDRRNQSDVILTEIERLTRLFQNILEMARIDAGALATETRWVHPSEIIAAAREHVDRTTRHHTLDVYIDPDIPLELDPRPVATAVAHVLENAAQYSPEGSTIRVKVSVNSEGLVVQVRDHGPGIAADDLPRLFERFYRGAAARPRSSGTGMGLSIARGLLASVGGRIWAENHPDGGALFTIVVPAGRRSDAGVPQ